VLILLIAVMVALYFLVTTEKQEQNPAADTPAPTRLGGSHGAAAPAGKHTGKAQAGATAAPTENAVGEGEAAPATNTLAPAPSG
jgi:hypothetical protein